jgi:hypothetical protein
MALTASEKPQIRTFLSHKYKAATANLYFWSILSKEGNFQFEVDEGTKPTSVTRLELMIREAHAIVGIFTLLDPEQPLLPDEIFKQSAYFRLETDLAIRSGRPTLLYIDRRYSSIFRLSSLPTSMRVEYFDTREIHSGTRSPSHERFRESCREFCREVLAYKAHELSRAREIDPGKIAIVVSANAPGSAYTSGILERIAYALETHGIKDPTIIRYPSRDPFQLSAVDEINWAIADVGPELFRTGLIGYMHGRFIPMMRLLHDSFGKQEAIGEHRCLHAGIDKGYDSDLLRWKNADDLAEGLSTRLQIIQSSATLVANSKEARNYFNKAALRKESIFLSYSGEDITIAVGISKVLKTRFQDVFDYKDGKSIREGEPWLEEIDFNLKRSAVGIQLLSATYLASPHCMQEARIMNNLSHSKKMRVLPVRLRDQKLASPAWLSDKQYIRFTSASELVDTVLRIIDKAA